MMKNFSKIFGSAALSLFLALLPGAVAHALTISPPTFDHSLNPGDSQLDSVAVYNEGNIPLTLYPMLYNFEAGADSEVGSPQLYPEDENRNGQALAQWITLDRTSFTLQPGERRSVPFTINIPSKDLAQPGGHYGVVIFSLAPPALDGQQSQVSLESQIGALVLVEVSGDLNETGSIVEFGFTEKKPWYLSRPIDMFVRVENGGNTHLRPTGNVFIKNWFGRQVSAPKVNEDYRSVLPHSIRRYEFSWAGTGRERPTGFFPQVKHEWNNFALGRYNAQLALTYGSKGQILSSSRSFWVWPWHLMVVLIIVLVLVIALLYLWKRSNDRAVIRRYERRRGA